MNQNGALALRAGHPTRSGFSAERSAVAPVLIRKHPRTRIVNSWLILIGIVGAIIAVADGLKRPPNSDLEPLPQSLQYDPYSAALLLAGILVCQIWVIPKAVETLLGFNEWLDLEPDLRLKEWLGFAVWMPLAFGLSFQTPLVMLLLERLGLLTIASYRSKRRLAWFFMAVIAGVVTPPFDVMSMLFLWVVLGLLYEVGILCCGRRMHAANYMTGNP